MRRQQQRRHLHARCLGRLPQVQQPVFSADAVEHRHMPPRISARHPAKKSRCFAANDPHARGAGGQHDMGQLLWADAAVGRSAGNRTAQAFEQRLAQAGKGVGGEQRLSSRCFKLLQAHGCAGLTAQAASCGLGLTFQTRREHQAVRVGIERVGCLHAGFQQKPGGNHFVEIFVVQKIVASRGANFKHAVVHLQHRHIERAAAQIEHQHRAICASA